MGNFGNAGVLTSTLFARPSFLTGYARALDVAGTFDSYNVSNSETQADCNAIAQDWKAVGSQLSEAMSASE